MPFHEILITQLQFHRWATGLILEQATALSAEQLMTGLKGSFNCVYDTCVHLYQADRVWLDRLEGSPPRKLEDYAAPGCMWELRDAWLETHDRMLAIIAALDESGANRVIAYKNLAGQPFSSPLWQIVLHVVNHGTHHRGQIASMIRQLGHVPKNIDLIRFYRTAAADAELASVKG